MSGSGKGKAVNESQAIPPVGEARPQPAGADRASVPQFYQDPNVLDPALHGRLRMRPTTQVRFAANTNSIAIGANEFYLAQAHYPIVFTLGAPISVVAVVGLEDARNLFVDKDGSWASGSYIPAYVRRYPFVMVQVEGRNDLILAFDRASDAISETEGEPLMIDGKPTPLVQRALEFCAAFQQQVEIARQFAAALAERKLLVENRAQLSLPSGMATSLSGFQVIDEARFNTLPDDVLLDWHRRGWLGLVFAHLMSMHRWEALGRLAAL